jgi:hypothetical protein
MWTVLNKIPQQSLVSTRRRNNANMGQPIMVVHFSFSFPFWVNAWILLYFLFPFSFFQDNV